MIVYIERRDKDATREIEKEILVFDGAMGTQLQAAKLKAGEIPEYLNITDPNLIQKIHLDYLNAGANFITTNTFGANPLKLKDAPYQYNEIIEAAINNAIIARKKLIEKMTVILF